MKTWITKYWIKEKEKEIKEVLRIKELEEKKRQEEVENELMKKRKEN